MYKKTKERNGSHRLIRSKKPVILDAGIMGERFSRWKDKPRVILMLESKCNLSCKHCYVPYDGSWKVDEALSAITLLSRSGFSILVSGSENLLQPEYLSCYKAAGQKHILSNGILLAEETRLFNLLTDNGIEEVCFSCNFDQSSNICSVPTSIVAKAAENSIKRGLIVRLSTLMTSNNFHKVLEYCSEAQKMGAKRIGFYSYMDVGNAQLGQNLAITPEQERKFFLELELARRSHPKSELEIMLLAGFGPRPGSRGAELAAENLFCPAGINLFAITPDRKVYGCPFTIGIGTEIGILTEEGLMVSPAIEGVDRRTCIAKRTFAQKGGGRNG